MARDSICNILILAKYNIFFTFFDSPRKIYFSGISMIFSVFWFSPWLLEQVNCCLDPNFSDVFKLSISGCPPDPNGLPLPGGQVWPAQGHRKGNLWLLADKLPLGTCGTAGMRTQFTHIQPLYFISGLIPPALLSWTQDLLSALHSEQFLHVSLLLHWR